MQRLLTILSLFLLIPLVHASYSDTSNHKYQNAINYISNSGIVEGYSDGTFKPNNKINRAELLKIVLEANDVNTSDNLTNCFPDVRTDWYAKYVCKAKEIGIVGGYPDGTFKPGNNVNFVEALKILQKGYGVNIAEGNPWYQGYINEGEDKNLIPNDIYSYDTKITRGQMADMITRQLTYEDGTQGDYLALLPAGGMADTGQNSCFNNTSAITCPSSGNDFYGQDAQYAGLQPSYTDNGDGTVTDNNTGLMWQKGTQAKLTFDEGPVNAGKLTLAGYNDWRVPTIKELYSLMNFNGYTGSGNQDSSEAPSDAVPYIDTDYFDFEYGDPNAGD